ncbi:MAG: GvpL/GvpF family gas vesicle protein [Melioribacteraceae bacterium]
METPKQEGKYIYCIIGTNQPKTFGEHGIGGRGDELFTVCFNDIAAVVSNAPIINYPISKVNMLSHSKAIEVVMREHAVLPVRFSTIAEDEEKVKKILEKEYDKFKSLLNKLEDKKEIGLKTIFIENKIYKYILEKHKDIKTLKEKLGGSKAYNQLVEVGTMVENALNKEKDLCKNDFLNTLSPLAEEININKDYGELMILNAAFLVEKNREAEFDNKVHELDERYGDKIRFKYIDTVPPFNFVNLVIETGKY